MTVRIMQRLTYVVALRAPKISTRTTIRASSFVRRSFASSSSSSSSSTTTDEPNSSERPFKILGVQQIAIGSTDRSGLAKLWHDIFGLKVQHSVKIEKENVDEDILQVGLPQFPVEIDLMTPLDADKSPKVHQPPLNHIGLWVDDLPTAVDWMKRQGVRFTPGGIRRGASGYDVTFIHPKPAASAAVAVDAGGEGSAGRLCSPVLADSISGNGVLIELVQAPPDIVSEYNKSLTDAS